MSGASGPDWAPGYGHRTASIAPIACAIRERPEDFLVDEQLAFTPEGEGEHLFLRFEKRELTTDELLQRLARATGLERAAFGFAGRKDRRAVTSQWISARGLGEDDARSIELPGVRLLELARHPRKLRLGQLAGNRFRLRLASLADADREALEAVVAELARVGVPNWFGAQRFGASGRNFELGRLLVAGDLRGYVLALCGPLHGGDAPAVVELRAAIESGSRSGLKRCARGVAPELARIARQLERRRGDFRGALRALGSDLPRLHVSSLQSLIFNRLLAERMRARPAGLDELVSGDLAFVHTSGASFLVDEPGELSARLDAFELSPSAPLPGAREGFAGGAVGELEREFAADEGCTTDQMSRRGLGMQLDGARRPLRVPLIDPRVEFEPGAAWIAFELPRGSYATGVLEEIRKEFA